MKVVGLNGREYNLNLSKYGVRKNDVRKRSKHHIRARKLISETYNSYRILEEVKLQDFSNSILTISLMRDQKFHAKALQKDSNVIEAVMQDIYGSKIKLNIPTYKRINLPSNLKNIPITKPGSRHLK